MSYPSDEGRTVQRIRRRILLVLAVVALTASGVAAASGLTQSDVGPGQTLTLTVPAQTQNVITITVPLPDAGRRLQAALQNPADVPEVDDGATRRLLSSQLASLDAFLSTRPELEPYRAHIWDVAHHMRPPLQPRRVAAVLWCTIWFPHACGG